MFSLDADILSTWFGTGFVHVSFWIYFKYLSHLVLVWNSLMNKKFCWLHKWLGVWKGFDEVEISSSTNLYSMQTFGMGLIHLSSTYAFDKSGYISSKEQLPIVGHILWFRKKRNKTEDSEHQNKQRKMLTWRLCFL